MRLNVARVGRANGVRGEVTVEVRTDVPQRRFAPGSVLHVVPPSRVAGRNLPALLTVERARDASGVLVLRFAEIADRDAAEALRGVVLEAEVDVEAEREDDAWYDTELVGLAVRAPDGDPLGEVVGVEHPGAQDLLVVRCPDGVNRLVPFVSALVPTVDVAAGYLVVQAPAGLLED
jgi:16S rRNA processing protein RimM